MRNFFYEMLIDKKPILVPDADLQMALNDLDSDESGRDESGFMHRIVLRRQVKTWSLSYAHLTAEEYRYMESLFEGKDSFQVTYRGLSGRRAACTAYRAKHSLTIHNIRTGTCRNYSFNIIEC